MCYDNDDDSFYIIIQADLGQIVESQWKQISQPKKQQTNKWKYTKQDDNSELSEITTCVIIGSCHLT